MPHVYIKKDKKKSFSGKMSQTRTTTKRAKGPLLEPLVFKFFRNLQYFERRTPTAPTAHHCLITLLVEITQDRKCWQSEIYVLLGFL